MRLTKYSGLAVWGVVTAGFAVGVGCSDDAVVYEPGSDATLDGSSDAKSDGSRDGANDASDGGSDGGNDAGNDSGNDSGSDSGNDAGDGGSDAGDGGADDAGDAAGTPVERFQADVANAFCTGLAGCCNAGTFTKSKCVTSLTNRSYDNMLQGLEIAGVANGTRLSLDAARRTQCLAAINGMNLCSPITGAQSRALLAACGGAVQGTAARGDACRADIECVSGNYCAGMNVATATEGVCTAISAAGENCDFSRAGYNGRVTNCSTRGFGDNGMYCPSAPSVNAGKCSPLEAAGASCGANYACTNQYCAVDTATCEDTASDQGLCFFGQ